ncbi:MAG: hypothetical protein EBY28_25215 [Betaproteobacteria bacterium]|nr:hypothetical protein [Betaproteobacteria bacterium]
MAVDGHTRQKRHLTGELTRVLTGVHIKSSDFVASAGIPAPTAKCILGVLQAAEVLRTLVPGGGRRAAVLGFPALLDITEGREVF